MIVCLCANVSERKLRATIAGGATTVKEVERRCGAGAGCGACRPLIRECLRAACQASTGAADQGITPFVGNGAPQSAPA
jgi:bacterioferritin-associated ferredoxin